MWRRRSDIPFSRDGSVRFLPGLIAVMVYLAGLALAGMLVLDATLQRWDRSLTGTLTVQLPPAEEGKGDGGLAVVLKVLRGTPGVTSATALGRDATARLLEPWLGDLLADADLPLPRLIDLRIDPENAPDLAALRGRLTAAAPNAVLDDHHRWLDRLASLVLSIELTALAVVVLVAAAAVMTVVFTTRAGLAVHHAVIEVLHLIGARDGYIAGQFERQALSLALRGGVVGLVFAAGTLVAIGQAGEATSVLGDRVRLLPSVALAPWHWLAMALLPLAAAVIAMMTARITVLRALARMP